ncbi:hypothetical protein [Streptomyces sp. NPDC051776]|uniref:hypothetical protein n=1 Tax=Streptomyces sp. NPDC051776 TaxID=3155414 RepID=UPI00342C01CC
MTRNSGTEGATIMKNGQAVLAVVGGYVLGRTRKTRLALGLAALAASRGLGSRGLGEVGGLMKSPEAERLAKDLRERLATVGRAALTGAVGHRVDALSDRIEKRTSVLRGGPSGGEEAGAAEPGDEEAGAAEPGDEGRARAAERSARKRSTGKASGAGSRTAKTGTGRSDTGRSGTAGTGTGRSGGAKKETGSSRSGNARRSGGSSGSARRSRE